MKKIFFLLLFICFTAGNAAELIRNSQFSQLSPAGLPTGWQTAGSPGSQFEVKDNILSMCAGDATGRAMLIQRDLVLPVNTPLLVSYEAMAESGAVYRIYIETTKMENGKKQYRSFVLQPTICGTGKFENIQDCITIPAGWENPYIVIRVIGNKKCNSEIFR